MNCGYLLVTMIRDLNQIRGLVTMRLRNEVCGAEKQDGTACEDISVSILTHMLPLHRRYSLIYHVDKVISSMAINRPVFLATPMTA